MKRVSYKKFRKLSQAIKVLNKFHNSLDMDYTPDAEEKFYELLLKVDIEKGKLRKKGIGINFNIMKCWRPDDPMDIYR